MSILPIKHQPLLDALNPGLYGRALRGNPKATLDVTHLPDLGHTASAARDLVPCMVDGAIPIPAKAGARPDAGVVESGSFLGVTTDDSESLAAFRSLCASSRGDSQVAGPSRDAEVDAKFQQTSSKQSFGLDIRA